MTTSFCKKLLASSLVLLLASPVWAADDPPRLKRYQEFYGWSGSTGPDLTSAGTVTGTTAAFTDFISCSALATDAGGNVYCTTGGSGDIEGVTAGNGLTGGGTSGTVTVDVGEGLAIDAAANSVALDPTELTGSRTWGDGSTDTVVWTWDRATGTDPTLTMGANTVTGPVVAASTAIELNGDRIADFTGTGLVQSGSALTASCTAITGSADLCDGSDADSGGATAWSAIGDPAGDAAIAMAETVQTLDWNTAAVASLAITGLSLTYTNDAAADILSQTLFRVANLAGANGIEVLQEIGNDDADDVATTGLLFTSAAGGMTTGIDLSDAEIGNALLVGANPIAFGNVAGTIGDNTADSITLVTDGTGTGEVVLPNNSIGAAELASGALPPREIWIPCVALLPIEAADAIPPPTKDAGTNIDQLPCTFDADADEGRTGNFSVQSRIEAGATVTITVFWYSLAATTGDAVWNIRHNSGTAADVDPDVALTTLTATDTTAGTAGQVSQTAITETQTNLAWVAGDLVYFTLHRDANNAADTLAGDALVVGVNISIPQL